MYSEVPTAGYILLQINNIIDMYIHQWDDSPYAIVSFHKCIVPTYIIIIQHNNMPEMSLKFDRILTTYFRVARFNF